MNDSSLADRAREENVKIKELLQQLLGIVENLPKSELAAWVEDLQQQSNKLCQHLKAHFAIEEDGGFMAPVIEFQPHLTPKVDALKEEHQTFVKQLEDLIQSIQENAAIDQTKVSCVCESYKTFIEALYKHENTENELMQKTFCEDIGTND